NTSNSSTPPTANQVNVDGSGSDQVIWSAPQNGGLGQWSATYAANTVQLVVPAGQLAGRYTATLTWQLDDTPQ
ncbi:WxL domain-containing protein, partial [Mycobacterium kansasii]